MLLSQVCVCVFVFVRLDSCKILLLESLYFASEVGGRMCTWLMERPAVR